MPSTTYQENLQQLVSNYDAMTGKTQGNLPWVITINDRPGKLSGKSIIEYPNANGQSITYDTGLSISPSSIKLSVGNKSIYSNPGYSEISLDRDVSIMSSFEVDIDSINRSSDTYYRSFDLFEQFSHDILGEYDPQEDFVGYSNGNIDIGVVLLRAPSPNKVKNSPKYLSEISSRGAIGTAGITSLEKVCEESYIYEDDRILTLVYRKAGKYYDFNGNEILPYSLNGDKFNLRYCGSSNISPLTLDNIGYDGRFMRDISYDSSLISYASSINKEQTYNTSYLPKKEFNTVINTYGINTNNKLKVLCSHRMVGNLQLIAFTVLANGYTYSTNPIAVDNGGVQLKPTIRNRDFSNKQSLHISDIFVTEGSVVDQFDSTYDSNLTIYSAPFIVPSQYGQMGGEVILDGTSLDITLRNYNIQSSTIKYSLYKDGELVVTENYLGPISITEPGQYTIDAYVFNNTYPTKTSTTTTYSVIVFAKASTPVLHYSTLTLDGTSTKDVEIYFTNTENITVLFSIDGTVPTVGYDGYFIAKPNQIFKLTSSATITYYSYNSSYLKSITQTQALTVVHSLTTPDPVITTSNASTLSDRVPLVITVSDVDDVVRYTLDGTTPNMNSEIYVAGTYLTAPYVGNSVTVKAIAYRYGSANSNVVTKTFIFNYVCAPWEHTGDVIINEGSITLNNNSKIIRSTKFNPNYSMAFDITSSMWKSILEISFDNIINDFNNYSGTYSTDINLTISNIYKNSEYSIYSIGSRLNRYDTDSYNKYGEIVVLNDSKLTIKYEVYHIGNPVDIVITTPTGITALTTPNTFMVRVIASNGVDTISSELIKLNISALGYQMLSVNSLYGNEAAQFEISDIIFNCN